MLTGSCLCGSVAYEVDAEAGPIVHCHCQTCRKTHGSAFSTVTNVPRDRFRWTKGENLLRSFESSPGKQRYFCTTCGSHAATAWRRSTTSSSLGGSSSGCAKARVSPKAWKSMSRASGPRTAAVKSEVFRRRSSRTSDTSLCSKMSSLSARSRCPLVSESTSRPH